MINKVFGIEVTKKISYSDKACTQNVLSCEAKLSLNS